ncbi:MAG TPA: hypothetical protein PLN19_09115, partial [Methanothrix sp.]|nr:hypothetical protein [Methanothrix sp.]HQE88410.1 hypothetical protein [Methanothrix sp.]HQI68537.1 hypothetical protein [Methanothrix sp.]HRS84997.1 hypothetical protein [Methanothrix sp.]HRT17113.1 hypothetical protein [Methanothrix sp.]
MPVDGSGPGPEGRYIPAQEHGSHIEKPPSPGIGLHPPDQNILAEAVRFELMHHASILNPAFRTLSSGFSIFAAID